MGNKFPHKSESWTIVKREVKYREYSLPNGDYNILIKARDPKSLKVSASFSTFITINSKTVFKMCFDTVEKIIASDKPQIWSKRLIQVPQKRVSSTRMQPTGVIMMEIELAVMQNFH